MSQGPTDLNPCADRQNNLVPRPSQGSSNTLPQNTCPPLVAHKILQSTPRNKCLLFYLQPTTFSIRLPSQIFYTIQCYDISVLLCKNTFFFQVIRLTKQTIKLPTNGKLWLKNWASLTNRYVQFSSNTCIYMYTKRQQDL